MMQNRRRKRSKSTASRISKLSTGRNLLPSIKEDDKEQITDEDHLSPKAQPLVSPKYATTD